MSNDYDGKRTWEIDTAEDIDGTFLLDQLVWHPGAEGQYLLVEDANGDEIWTIRSVAAAVNNEAYGIEQTPIFPSPGRKCRGIYISTIGGGTLFVKLNSASPLA